MPKRSRLANLLDNNRNKATGGRAEAAGADLDTPISGSEPAGVVLDDLAAELLTDTASAGALDADLAGQDNEATEDAEPAAADLAAVADDEEEDEDEEPAATPD